MKRAGAGRRREETGAVAIFAVVLSVVLFGIAALSVDITMQVNERQKLHDTIDSAAHAGAFALPDGAAARTAALAMAHRNDASVSPTVDFWCVVAAVAGAVDTSQLPATCNPGPAPYDVAHYPGLRCNESICAIPCDPESPQNDACNTMRVGDSKSVPFKFAPVIGVQSGGTGSIVSVACKGSCGTVPPNPMDVVVVADRTGSMSTPDRNSMIDGIQSMAQVMTPEQQFLALATIGPSRTTAPVSCRSQAAASVTSGANWVPVGYSSDYVNPSGHTPNPNSTLHKAVHCLTASSTGTYLAMPMKAAAQYLLDPTHLVGLPARGGTVHQAIIFETDGQPNENNAPGTTSLTNPGLIGSGNGNTACTNLKTVAANAKSAGILVVTVAYNLATDKCGTGASSPTVASVLAATASPRSATEASLADNSCASAAGRTAENVDGDYFFCAASGDNLAPLFKTAFGQLSNSVRLIKMP